MSTHLCSLATRLLKQSPGNHLPCMPLYASRNSLTFRNPALLAYNVQIGIYLNGSKLLLSSGLGKLSNDTRCKTLFKQQVSGLDLNSLNPRYYFRDIAIFISIEASFFSVLDFAVLQPLLGIVMQYLGFFFPHI